MPASPTTLIAAASRIVVKVGSSLIVDSASATVRTLWLTGLGADVAALRTQGKEIILVSSGAVGLGRPYLGMKRAMRLAQKQAAAAAGQSLLMQAWQQALAPHNIPVAQLLLTYDDTERRRRWLNARATIETLLAHKALPVINENDSVATDELRFGDNDRLSARAAQMVRADLLVLLSDVDGLYSADPARDPSAAALAAGKSLLAAGVVEVRGDYGRGSCLAILDRAGRELGRGISTYDSGEARCIAGSASSRIEALLGYGGPAELIHRDDMAVLGT